MILCNDCCEPCCDFCLHAIHEEFTIDGELVIGGPIACNIHNDEEHNDIAESCGYCDDFHCFKAK